MLIKERDELKRGLETLSEELKDQKKKFDIEIGSYKETIEINKKDIDNMVNEKNNLSSLKNQLELDLNFVKIKYEEEKDKLTHVTEELEKLKLAYNSSIKDSQIDLKVKIERVTNELNDKWKDKLK